MSTKVIHHAILLLSAAVWFVNGMYCKILNRVPRHQEIVEHILQISNGRTLTIIIGLAEVLMSIWIISRWREKLCVFTQMFVVIMMNILEFALAPQLLLWGRMNIVFAMCFVILIYCNEFFICKKVSINQ